MPKFAFQCTASTNGQESIPDFRARPRSHFVATTVDLLSTGVDVPCVRNIVFLRFLQSPILFHQMVGRGTRIDEGTGKLMFTIWDYTGATSLFGADLITPPPPRPPTEPPPGPPPPPPPGPPPVQAKGTAIDIREAGEFLTMQVEGRLQRVTVEHYRARLTEKLLALSPDLADFRRRWLDRETHHELLQTLEDQGLNIARLPEVTQEAEDHQFDLLAALVFGAEPRKRSERAAAFRTGSPEWLVRLPQPAAEVVKKIVRQFEAGGVGALETTELFRQVSAPGQDALTLLKQAGAPAEILQKTKEGLFVA